MAATQESPRVLGLCSGIGGLELAARSVWPRARVVACVERDPYAASVLLARMEDEAMEPAPVWCGDLADFDGRTFRGRVDLVTAGIPCQPWSLAGAQKGVEDPRHLGPQLIRIIREARPGAVLVENVPGFQAAFARIAQELAALGFDAEWGRLRAEDIGAPHRRERIFLLAAHPGRVLLGNTDWWRRWARGEGAPVARAYGAAWAMADADGGRREVERGQGLLDFERQAQRHDVDGCGGALADTNEQRRDGRAGKLGPRGRREPAHGGAVSDADCEQPGFGRWVKLSEEATKRRHLPEWQAEPDVGRVAHGVPSRVDRLRCLGNAVVPAQGAAAIVELATRLGLRFEEPLQ